MSLAPRHLVSIYLSIDSLFFLSMRRVLSHTFTHTHRCPLFCRNCLPHLLSAGSSVRFQRVFPNKPTTTTVTIHPASNHAQLPAQPLPSSTITAACDAVCDAAVMGCDSTIDQTRRHPLPEVAPSRV
ncbi:hypothetical protein PTSG_12245 [Salpingoeca rosetta]|uniref:Uncharacterized protein n=1 Tax=Salpingoeca rosetta (strain ATCC 50818 / BSB-021) TaxID=946362 RepID=F2U9B9_SALR5|nr:uncharacterized protein PTSG_12245 [Salpingoeca rosetta]EGD73322.1 hypothetical protein PTSG_12245 [Salpingoeca rosetta]|eukprot:XP_004994352.1 hypothetical protein PTSG_12245 [Salpingoeca rosetta]